jgi:diguanylate cyclase (GGDEF)-like protein
VDRAVSPEAAGRLAGALFFLSGALVGVTAPFIPAPSSVNRPALVALALCSVLVGAAIWDLPWARWSPHATLWLVPVALALVALHNSFSGLDGFRYPVFFFIIFGWMGATHPAGTSVKFLPLACAAFLVPLFVAHATGVAVASVGFVLPTCLLVAESVAWMGQRLRRALHELDEVNEALERSRAESQHRAKLLATVARAGGAIASLRSDEVLAAVSESVLALEFDSTWFCFFDDDSGTFRVGHVRGALPEALTQQRFNAAEGLATVCRNERRTVTVDDYQTHPLAIPAIVDAGIQSAMLVPVRVDNAVPAVLIGASHHRMAFHDNTLESMELLAAHAGHALANAAIHEEERRTSQILAEVSLRDELTGIGNRRHAVALLDSLLPGDAVLLVDLDHFKDVNDTDGHAAGDAVLASMGAYLRSHLRYEDSAARYGGEEFLVIVRQVPERAVASADRLLQGWQNTRPRTTISIGVAVHSATDAPAVTLGHADVALYTAKRRGRNQVSEFDFEEVST